MKNGFHFSNMITEKLFQLYRYSNGEFVETGTEQGILEVEWSINSESLFKNVIVYDKVCYSIN